VTDLPPLSTPARRLVEVLAEFPRGLTVTELTEAARARIPGLAVARINRLLSEATAAEAVTERDGRLHVAHAGPEEEDGEQPRRGLLRAVVVDVESVVHTTAVEPYTDRRVYQIGAVRIGADADWVAAEPRLSCWLELPADGDWTIASNRVRRQHAAEALPPAAALAALKAYADDADAVVAYNGTDADFPMLAQAFDREGMPGLGGQLVDAYYLALAVWPTAPSHRLALLADHVGVDTSDLKWHDAADDCVQLSRVLEAAAARIAAWPPDQADLLASVAPESAGWTLLRQIAGSGTALGQAREFSHAQVAAVAQVMLAGHDPVRGPSAGVGRGPLPAPEPLLGADGRVDPVALAAVVHGGDARPRPAQQQMTAALHQWADDGVSGLIEAPTGTGKSFAVLAAALDWLAGDPARIAVVSTYTKQLQAQLSEDVALLEAAVPGLVAAADVVKGASMRLSLRALLVALADATADGQRRRPGAGSRFLDRPVFRELLLFLLLRMAAGGEPQDAWAAQSVDPVDVPAFFADYAGPALPVWLQTLSQGASGEYDATSSHPIAVHTSVVTEALATHRLILANHALLLAHLGDLTALGDHVLLIVDEAHQLEDAATSALTTELDYRALEDLYEDLVSWSVEHGGATGVAAAVGNLGRLLDHEQLPKAASLAFDARSGGVGAIVGARTVTLASPYAGTAGVAQVRRLAALLTRLSGLCQAVTGALGAHLALNGTGLDYFQAERIRTLITRFSGTDRSVQLIVEDIDAVLAPPRDGAAAADADDVGSADAQNAPDGETVDDSEDDDGGEAGSENDDTAAADADAMLEAEIAGDDEGSDGEDSDGGGVGHGVLTGMPNRVAFAEEADLPVAGLRRYRFRIAVAPIELPREPAWQQFLAGFRRTFYVSATLRVAGEWTFIRDRLGLDNSVRDLSLDTPFDMASQAELVCFSDFPSWAEQSEGAMRTVAHQLSRYAIEMVNPRPARDEADGEGVRGDATGGFDGGAMVLTTSRSAAGGIADYLATELRRAGDGTPVRSALVLGNPQAVRAFTDTGSGGGFLVGTKGLWQGVDVADPERLRLVWINKLPFAPFAAPVIEARRAAVTQRAEHVGAEDPDAEATQDYYIPLAALQLRQAVGRLIRSERHRGVIVISDRKLAGSTALRRVYRQAFLGSLDPKLLREDPDTGELGGGNVMPMTAGWRRIWEFFAGCGLLDPARAEALSSAKALEEHTLLPQTRAIKQLELDAEQARVLAESGELADTVVARAEQIAGLLRLSDQPVALKPSQEAVIRAVAEGRNVLGLLPTGFGKSFCFQLSALALPGVTIVVSPLVALMHDQALELNRSIGGAVRALVAPLRESSSRAGKTEVADQLLGRADHGIRLVYTSPERLCQARFREVVRDAVASGRVRRIVLDEAHTFVSWGDDFRPAFRRVERFLAELRKEFGLPVTALTATANRAVRAGLREGVFGLSAEPPEQGDGEALVTVTENPIRPELAIFRRSMGGAGRLTTAGLAEDVVDEIRDHAIFYCLTVKEVVALHAQLREYLGEAGVRVRRFHGRLTEAEKAATMTEFREAPERGQEGFAPLVVVATSAFGLGINRPDVRTVFCVSPPTDLAALYQQLGRAGRDAAGKELVGATDPAEDGTDSSGEISGPRPANMGLTLFTRRGLSTVQFMTGQDLSNALLARMGSRVLACGGVLDAVYVADELIAEDQAAGVLSAPDAQARRTSESYTAGVVRAFAALASLGAVEDLGDFPPTVKVQPGELPARGGDDPAEQAVTAALLALPAQSAGLAGLGRRALEVVRADAYLASTVPGYRELAGDASSTWQLLADLHDRGRLDVSAAPSRHLVTGMTVHVVELPSGFADALAGKAARAAGEVALLRNFFEDFKTCANIKFAEYFGTDVPEACCTTEANRCSACWDYRTDYPAGQKMPLAADTLLTAKPRRAGARTPTVARERRLDDQVQRLIWTVDRGLSAYDIQLALRGEDSWFYAKQRRRIRLPTTVVTSRLFGADPAVKLEQIQASLARLSAAGKITPAGSRWRDVDNVARQARREARALGTSGVAS